MPIFLVNVSLGVVWGAAVSRGEFLLGATGLLTVVGFAILNARKS